MKGTRDKVPEEQREPHPTGTAGLPTGTAGLLTGCSAGLQTRARTPEFANGTKLLQKNLTLASKVLDAHSTLLIEIER